MGVLLLLITIAGTIAAALLYAAAHVTGRTWLRNFAAGGAAIWLAVYASMLVVTSLNSTERLLGLNQPKAFCGLYLDCHMHAEVTGVRTARTIGARTAIGIFYVISVKVFSNARAATLGLASVDAGVVDLDGRRYARDEMAEAELAPQPGFETPVRPGESFTKEIVFDLPPGVRSPMLDLREGSALERTFETLLIGDEDSLFHQRAYFYVLEQNEVSGVK